MINTRLRTPFGEELPKIPLDRHPRPQLRREVWQTLNGEWDFAIYKTGELFGGYKNKIIVPFSPEAPLSGVMQTVKPDDTAYYRRSFEFKRVRDVVLLHFGAVDYRCVVYLNGTLVGRHRGGYFPFSFNVSDVIKDGEIVAKKELVLPKEIRNIYKCKNPRCISSIEQELPQIFVLDEKKEVYRCKYCDEKYSDGDAVKK